MYVVAVVYSIRKKNETRACLVLKYTDRLMGPRRRTGELGHHQRHRAVPFAAASTTAFLGNLRAHVCFCMMQQPVHDSSNPYFNDCIVSLNPFVEEQ